VLARTPPWLLSAALAVAYLLIDPPSADLAAQEYRAWVFEHHGLVLWDNAWYGGHHMPGYSVLFPPLAGWLGPKVVGALSAVAAAWLFERIAEEHFGPSARAGSWWFAAATAVNLLTGRLTFALGCALALAAILAVTHRRTAIGAALAALSTLGSPVAGLFVGLGAAAWFVVGPRRAAAVALGVAAVAPALLLAGLFPEGGIEPFVPSSFWPSLLTVALVFFALPRTEGVLRVAVVLYALAMIASFVLDTPMGGNVTRLGAVFAGPVLACLLWPRHAGTLALVVAPLVYWQWNAPVRDWRRASGDPSLEQRYYAGVETFLAGRQAQEGPLRIEVPFTRNHWEARWMAMRFALARGWERQLDIGRNGVFYEGTLTPARLEAWLRRNAVSYVAVPDAELDHSAEPERRLVLAGRVAALAPVWRDAHWRVFRVRRPTPHVTGGRLVRMGHDDFTVRLPRGGGEALVRIRWTRWWRASPGGASVREAPGDWTLVRGAGDVTVRARL
jgi:hypothetical protein